MERLHFDRYSLYNLGINMAIAAILGLYGAIFAEGLSIGKEYGDSCYEGNHFCLSDLIADNVGILLGLLIHHLFSELIGG